MITFLQTILLQFRSGESAAASSDIFLITSSGHRVFTGTDNIIT